jgi:hypothetical protein
MATDRTDRRPAAARPVYVNKPMFVTEQAG